MVMECNTGLTELITKVIGRTTKLKDKVPSGMPRGMSIEVTSKTIWRMGMENTPILMAPNIRVNSETMFKKDMEKRSGSMVPNMSEATKMV